MNIKTSPQPVLKLKVDPWLAWGIIIWLLFTFGSPYICFMMTYSQAWSLCLLFMFEIGGSLAIGIMIAIRGGRAHYYVRSGQLELLKKEICERGNVNSRTWLNRLSLLHLAVRLGNDEAIHMLAKLGADMNARTRAGRTPLDIATAKNDLKTSQLLKSLGAAET